MNTTSDFKDETFSNNEVICALEQFLEYGESQYGKSQQGYFSGSGFAARCLRFHLEELKKADSFFKMWKEHETNSRF